MNSTKLKLSKLQLFSLITLRILIGWHFLYEGVSKVMNSNWSSQSYLLDSKGWFSGIYHYIANSSSLLKFVDILNVYGLLLIGLGLILGFLTKLSNWAGIILLSFYFLSHPTLVGVSYALPGEGSYLWVNKILIELAAMVVLLAFPTGKKIGLDRLIKKL